MIMWVKFFILLFLGVDFSAAWVGQLGPKFKPTEGEVWPKAQYEVKQQEFYRFVPWKFTCTVIGESCGILERAIARLDGMSRQLYDVFRNSRLGGSVRSKKDKTDYYLGYINELKVQLTKPCEDYPYLYMDESYNLTISRVSNLKSESLWGIIRGLETFTHLLYISSNEVRINATTIFDYPRFAHRGLLIDTSRHFISVKNILRTIDAMAQNKMNVFHWHIVDDSSFPFQSERFPELSLAGAFHPSMVYRRDHINKIVDYARDRAVRVVPEFDVPGHTRSWGSAFPELLAKCYDDTGMEIGFGPMHPLRVSTYKMLRELFKEVQEWFPDQYLHVGGDEVALDCWDSNPELKEYMKSHNITSNMLHGFFMKQVIPLLKKSTPIVWQEVIDNKVKLSNDTLVQVWKYKWITEMVKILRAGHKVIYSSSWYLDYLHLEFDQLFTPDPRAMVYDATGDVELTMGIVGGEACMWGEMVDDRNLLNRVWPRASAVAERLWSPPIRRGRQDIDIEKAKHRIEEHACRMNMHGVPAEPPNGPGFCLVSN